MASILLARALGHERRRQCGRRRVLFGSFFCYSLVSMPAKAIPLLVVAVAIGLLSAPTGAKGGDWGCTPGGARGCSSTAPATASAAEDLAEKHAPVIYLREQAHECDRSGGAFEPSPVEIVLGNPEVALRRAEDGGFVKRGPTAADVFSEGRDAYLDFPGNPRRPGCKYERDGRRFGADLPYVTYAHIAREEGFEGLALQYWFFYYFNDWNNRHEGDWEMIQIAFEAASAAEALTQDPVRVAYSQHSGGEIALWTDKKLRREGPRPVVYVAAGSQANFFGPHIYIGRAEEGAGFGCDDASPPGRRLSLGARLVPAVVTDPDDPFAWLAFGGRWGEPAGPEFNGPTGPAAKSKWSSPFSWEETLRYSSVRVPSRSTIGPNAVDAFCSVVAFTTDLFLPIILELPLISAVALGACALGLMVSLTRTRYLPIQAKPLRARRRIGQILISALEVYRRRARLFLGSGLAFIPAAALVAGVHWLVLNVSPVDAVVPVSTSNVGQEVVLVFALAELEFGLAYAIVLAATTAALASYEAGSPIGVRGAFKRVWSRLPHLALPRLAAVLIVGALAFTVIGIPLALRQAVRWTFLEQAVLLEGKSGVKSFGESSSAVKADWWWSVGASVALGALGLVAAPALGIILILAYTQLPLLYVNLISSAVYVALAPYVAIALALVYFDLKSREG
jgi:hypothetical protein